VDGVSVTREEGGHTHTHEEYSGSESDFADGKHPKAEETAMEASSEEQMDGEEEKIYEEEGEEMEGKEAEGEGEGEGQAGGQEDASGPTSSPLEGLEATTDFPVHDEGIHVPPRLRIRAMTHSYMRHDACVDVP